MRKSRQRKKRSRQRKKRSPSRRMKKSPAKTLRVWAGKIINDHFRHLPSWVDKKKFKNSMTKHLVNFVTKDYKKIYGEKPVESVNLEYILREPVIISDWVDPGASGGMDGKYDENHMIYDLP